MAPVAPDPGPRPDGPAVRRRRSAQPSSGRISRGRGLLRYALTRTFSWLAVRALFRVRFEGRNRLPTGPALVCFNHQSWTDPFILLATLPWRPRLYFFGPKESDMSKGTRNRIMKWTGTAIPFRPTKDDLVEATHRVEDVLATGGVVAIAGEGRIHSGERELLPLDDGAAFFALRAGVPFVPVAINGTSWLAFGRIVRVRVGEPIPVGGKATRDAVAALSARGWTVLHELIADYPDPTPPPPGSVWYRLTETFNEWPEGARLPAEVLPPGVVLPTDRSVAAAEVSATGPDDAPLAAADGPSAAGAERPDPPG